MRCRNLPRGFRGCGGLRGGYRDGVVGRWGGGRNDGSRIVRAVIARCRGSREVYM